MKSLHLTTTFFIIFVLFSTIVWSAKTKEVKEGSGATNFVKRELLERSDTNLFSKRELGDEQFDAEFRKRSEDGEFHKVHHNKLKRNNLSKRALSYTGGRYTRFSCNNLCRRYNYYAFCNYAIPSYCVCFNQ